MYKQFSPQLSNWYRSCAQEHNYCDSNHAYLPAILSAQVCVFTSVTLLATRMVFS